MDQQIAVAKKTVAKYFAVQYGVADTVSISLEQSLALYGLLRLSEMDIGIDRVAEVDRIIANLLVLEPDDVLMDLHNTLGGLACAYRFFQGAYKIGRPETSHLNRLVEKLCNSLTDYPPTPENLLAVCPILSMAAVVLHRPDLHDASIAWFDRVHSELFDPVCGLYRHIPRESSAYWGYANGCIAAALVEILRTLPYSHPSRTRLIRQLQQLLTALLARQASDGLWQQSVCGSHSYTETSGSALILYALFSVLGQPGLALEGWQAKAEKAWDGLKSRVNVAGNGNIHGVCAERSAPLAGPWSVEYPQTVNELAGFGPIMLACAAALWQQRGLTWDRLELPVKKFEPPSRSAAAAYFAGVHAICEHNRNADGSYFHGTSGDPDVTFDEIIKESRTDHPIPRDTAHCVLGYMEMLQHDPEPIYRERARAGLDWLVKEQEPDGCYRLWTRKREGQVPHHGCLFETGIAASALAKGYDTFQDERYLVASARAARWELDWPVDRNVNFNAFAIWHLAEHYRLTHDDALLERTIYKTRQAMLVPQQGNGGWTGHNSWIWYHGINVRAYAALYSVLPERHPFRGELGGALRASLSYALHLQTDNGAIHPNPDNLDKPSHLMFEIMVGLGTAARCLDDPAILACLNGLTAYRVSPESGDPDRLFNNEKGYWLYGCSPWYVYALGMWLNLMN